MAAASQRPERGAAPAALRCFAGLGLVATIGAALLDAGAAAGVRESLWWRPSDPQTWAALAQSGPEGEADLRALLERFPRRTDVRLRLAERVAGTGEEETVLRAAARWDRGFEPAWRLANLYARAGCGDEAWRWLRAAARVWREDPRPLFRLAGICATEDAGAPGGVAGVAGVARRLWPEDPEMEWRYLDYLVRAGDGAAGTLAAGLAGAAETKRAAYLAAYLAQALARGAAADAGKVWWPLAARGWLSARGPAETTAPWPGDPGPLGWSTTREEGARVEMGKAGEIEIELTGAQKEQLWLVCRKQLLAAGDYRLQVEAERPAPRGVEWVVRAGGVAAGPAAEEKLRIAARDGEIVEACLVYTRPQGEPRARARFRAPRLYWSAARPAERPQRAEN